jgi:hypothetical protein
MAAPVLLIVGYLVTVICIVVGFLVYRRYNKPADADAQQDEGDEQRRPANARDAMARRRAEVCTSIVMLT